MIDQLACICGRDPIFFRELPDEFSAIGPGYDLISLLDCELRKAAHYTHQFDLFG